MPPRPSMQPYYVINVERLVRGIAFLLILKRKAFLIQITKYLNFFVSLVHYYNSIITTYMG